MTTDDVLKWALQALGIPNYIIKLILEEMK